MTKKIEFLSDEYWYGGAVDLGEKYPIGADDEFFIDTTVNPTPNQLNPVFLSNKGRYIWLNSGGSISFKSGTVTLDAPEAEFCVAGKTLRDAALAAAPTG